MLRRLLLVLALVAPHFVQAQVASPHAIDIPPWFTESFLDFREDIREAAKEGKRLVAYFGQDGCPYCTQLMQSNFRQPETVAKMRRHFVAVALNIWGDRETTWLDGRVLREKELAKALKVQFTPTLLFFDEKGAVVARLNGYYPPRRLDAVLDYVAGRMETQQPLAAYLKTLAPEEGSEKLHDQPFFLPQPWDLRRKAGAKPLAVLFETNFCRSCDELHLEAFRRPDVLEQVKRVDVARLHVAGRSDVVTPAGRKLSVEAWARELKILYTPTIVFFDARGREVFRSEAYMRPFHTAGSFEYVASGAYAKEPSFQRFLQAKAERLKERGQRVELWK
jgi:thioredoxin-related protein